jgi:hypothetical protein
MNNRVTASDELDPRWDPGAIERGEAARRPARGIREGATWLAFVDRDLSTWWFWFLV